VDTIVIYHGNCDDGFGSAIAAYKALGDQVEYIPAEHGSLPPDVTGKKVYILDFSYKKDVMLSIASAASEVILLDHHVTAQNDLEELFASGLIQGKFDMTQSGAVMSWQYFHSAPLPQLFLHIQDRDLWQFKLPYTQEITAALQNYPQTFENWLPFLEDLQPLIDQGKPIQQFFKRQIEALLNRCYRATIAGFDVPIVNAPSMFASDLGDIMTQGEPFAAIFHFNHKGTSFSLRSTDKGENVSAIAELFGGGGHRNAAGFKLDHCFNGLALAPTKK
jgi:uncharacterized protein